MPVVKANAYGHGDLEIARLCAGAGADAFAVATAAEGVRLRRGGVRGTILILGYSGPELASPAGPVPPDPDGCERRTRPGAGRMRPAAGRPPQRWTPASTGWASPGTTPRA